MHPFIHRYSLLGRKVQSGDERVGSAQGEIVRMVARLRLAPQYFTNIIGASSSNTLLWHTEAGEESALVDLISCRTVRLQGYAALGREHHWLAARLSADLTSECN